MGEVPVATVVGEVDMSNAHGLRDSLLTAVTNPAPGLVLDLSRTTYLDSAGVQLVFDLARRLATRQQQLVIAVPSAAPIRRVLVLTNVGAVARMHEAAGDGVEDLRAGSGARPHGAAG